MRWIEKKGGMTSFEEQIDLIGAVVEFNIRYIHALDYYTLTIGSHNSHYWKRSQAERVLRKYIKSRKL